MNTILEKAITIVSGYKIKVYNEYLKHIIGNVNVRWSIIADDYL